MMQIDINNQTEMNVDEEQVRSVVLNVIAYFKIENSQIEIDFVRSEQIKQLNAQARHIDKPTDVLSFPQIEIGGHKPHLGNIVISPEVVTEKGEDMESVVKHGLLHLLGFDHETDSEKWDEAAKKINCKL